MNSNQTSDPATRATDAMELGAAPASWSDMSPGHVLSREGQPVTHLIYVASGVCRIQIDGTIVATIGAGGLIGEMTYHTGQPATATVIADAASHSRIRARRARRLP